MPAYPVPTSSEAGLRAELPATGAEDPDHGAMPSSGLERSDINIRISAMGDSEKDPVFSPQANQSESRSWVPMAAGGAFVLLLIVGVVLLTRGGKSTGRQSR